MDNDVKRILENLKQLKVEKLVREGKEVHFGEIQPQLEEIFNKLGILRENPELYSLIPENKKSNFNQTIKAQLDKAIERLKSFNPASPSAYGEKQSIIHDIKTIYDYLSDLFLRFEVYDLTKQLEAKNFKKINKEYREAINSTKETLEEVNKVLKAAQKASVATGTVTFSGIFGQEAKNHKEAAGRWFKIGIAITVILGGILIWIFSGFIKAVKADADLGSSVQILIAKILIFSFFTYPLYQIIKNYNANMHLHTINQHRQNSLNTFQAFVKSTEDKPTQDAVLLQATKCIFEVGDTGYLSSKDRTKAGVVNVFDHFPSK